MSKNVVEKQSEQQSAVVGVPIESWREHKQFVVREMARTAKWQEKIAEDIILLSNITL